MNENFLDENNSTNLSISTTTTLRSTTISSIPHREQVLIDAFNTYIQIGIGSLLFLFGLTFNCLSLVYFRVSRSFRQTTFQLYFSIISILDTIRLFEFLVFLLFDKGYLKVTLTLCRSIFFTIMFTGQASIWLTVALAVEKCVIIWFPIKGRLFFTMSISRTVLIFVLLLVFLADVIYLLPTFFLHTYENISIHTFMCVWQTGSQSSMNVYDQWKKHYFTFNTVFFHSIIPSFLLLILNWLILYSLSRQRDDLTKIGSIDAKNILKREKQFKEKTIQLVLSSFFVIITISPRYILTMVNAFATSISKTPIMPLYIYVNLNTVFRVLEMCNYSLNMIFAIMSGRTSRLEIRKLFWECFLWRFKRTTMDRQETTFHTTGYLLDEDDDDPHHPHHQLHQTRSINRQSPTPYSVLTVKSSGRHHTLSPKSSYGNYSSQQLRTTPSPVVRCCGFSIDLSNKDPHLPNSRSTIDESSTHRPTLCKTNTNASSSSKTASNTQLSLTHSLSPTERTFRQQKTVCYRSSTTYRPIPRRRATTMVHAPRKSSTEAMPTTNITSNPLDEQLTSLDCRAIEIEEIDRRFSRSLIPSKDLQLTRESFETDESSQTVSPAFLVERC